MTAESSSSDIRFFDRLRLWAVRSGLSRILAIALALASVAAGVATYVALTGPEFAPDPKTVLLLLNLDLVLLLLLGAVVARRIVMLWVERRRGSAGSKLHVRLVVLFSALAAAPAIIVAVFSGLFFNLGLQGWFSDKVRSALGASLAVAEAYLAEHRNSIQIDIRDIAADLNRSGATLLTNQRQLQQFMNVHAALRSLSEIVIFDDSGRVIGRSGLTLSLIFTEIPVWGLAKARDGEVVIFNPDSDDVSGVLGDRVRALVELDRIDGVFLLIGRYVDPRVVAHVDRTREAVQAYESLEGRRSGLQITFAMVFVLVALLLLFAAVWTGLVLANRLVRPVSALISAAERVRAGELSARVEAGPADDELGSLSRAFNSMTDQIEGQQRELVEANRQLDDRRRFTEAVLSGVSAGVVGLDGAGRINLPNRSASMLLATDLERKIGAAFSDVVPEMAHLLAAARSAPNRVAHDAVAVQRGGRRRMFTVRVAGEPLEGGAIGYVVTFDDVTDLESAQRKAAWADVARRIAHEIKNPLTPIQLSAERLKRKYLDEIKNDPETFRICTETIIRHVNEIGRMVDEFSSFARMPAPVMRLEDLGELVRETTFLQRNARPEIRFSTIVPAKPAQVMLDRRQVGQALTNLLQNAIDAIQGREPQGAEALPPGEILVRLSEDEGRPLVTVEDNGKGLPAENRDRLAEPYVTTRAKGTGLGLAIVKKIMEDHGGELILADRSGGGASVSLVFQPRTAASADVNRRGGSSVDAPAEVASVAGAGTVKAAIHGS